MRFTGAEAMTVNDWIHTMAGTFILLSLAFGVEASPLFLSKYWLWFTAFVGANLFQYGLTKFCPLGVILKKLGVRESLQQ
jgi:hypothetical protein